MYACVARNLLLYYTVLWGACGILGTAYSDFLCGTTLPDLHLGYVEKFLACSCHIYNTILYFKYYFTRLENMEGLKLIQFNTIIVVILCLMIITY